jgi:hypothetical protein
MAFRLRKWSKAGTLYTFRTPSAYGATTQPPPIGGILMPARRIFGSDSKTELLPIVISPDELITRLQTKTGLQDLILENNRDHVISGRAYNTTGYVLQLFEYLGRNTTVAEITAASEDPKLTERTIATGVNRLNEILYKLLGLKIQYVKDSGELRLVNQNDAISATENFAKKFAKVRDEFVRTMDAYRATGGDVAGLLAASDAGRKLASLGRVLTPAREQVEA